MQQQKSDLLFVLSSNLKKWPKMWLKSKVRLLGQAEIWRCSKGCQTKNNGENGDELAIYRAEWPEVNITKQKNEA